MEKRWSIGWPTWTRRIFDTPGQGTTLDTHSASRSRLAATNHAGSPYFRRLSSPRGRADFDPLRLLSEIPPRDKHRKPVDF